MRRRGQQIRYLFGLYLLAGLVLASAMALAASCGGAGTKSGGTPGGHATFAATMEAPPPAIEQILQRVAGVRGLSAPTGLRVGLVARADVPKLIDSLVSDDDRAQMARTTTLYRLLGLLGPDQDYLAVYEGYVAQALAGVYSPKDKALWVVYDGSEPDFSNLPTQERQTLEHELVHAVQDAHFDLDAIARKASSDLDLSLTATALIEGDAVSTQHNYDAKYAALRATGGMVMLADVSRLQATAPTAIQRELQFPYTQGRDWVDGIRQQGGNAAVDALFADLPDGTVFVFHPERIGTGWEPATVTLPGLAPALGDGWAKDSGGQLGQFEFQNYLQLRLPGLQAVQGADGWAGDHYDVYRTGDASAVVVRVRFDSEDDAREFVSAQGDLLKAEGTKASEEDGFTLRTNGAGTTTIVSGEPGDTVTFIVGSSADVALKAASALKNG